VEFASKADQFAAATRETAPAADRHSAWTEGQTGQPLKSLSVRDGRTFAFLHLGLSPRVVAVGWAARWTTDSQFGY
jgi:hypothetical protein